MSEEDSVTTCGNCGAELIACEKCDCVAPDSYVAPGSEALVYMNAYEVTRHYGGPEEGGWWYNFNAPLASIPIRAMSYEYHDSLCWSCNAAKAGEKDAQGNPIKACKWGFHLVAKQDEIDFFKSYLEDLYKDVTHGNIYSVRGGSELLVTLQDHPAEESSRPHYE